jgi:hypothetical protein
MSNAKCRTRFREAAKMQIDDMTGPQPQVHFFPVGLQLTSLPACLPPLPVTAQAQFKFNPGRTTQHLFRGVEDKKREI